MVMPFNSFHFISLIYKVMGGEITQKEHEKLTLKKVIETTICVLYREN